MTLSWLTMRFSPDVLPERLRGTLLNSQYGNRRVRNSLATVCVIPKIRIGKNVVRDTFVSQSDPVQPSNGEHERDLVIHRAQPHKTQLPIPAGKSYCRLNGTKFICIVILLTVVLRFMRKRGAFSSSSWRSSSRAPQRTAFLDGQILLLPSMLMHDILSTLCNYMTPIMIIAAHIRAITCP